jgi:hypothetical protein
MWLYQREKIIEDNHYTRYVHDTLKMYLRYIFAKEEQNTQISAHNCGFCHDSYFTEECIN